MEAIKENNLYCALSFGMIENHICFGKFNFQDYMYLQLRFKQSIIYLKIGFSKKLKDFNYDFDFLYSVGARVSSGLSVYR